MISETVQLALISAIVSAIPPTAAAILSWLKARQALAEAVAAKAEVVVSQQQNTEIASAVHAIHIEVNDRLSRLLAMTAEAAHAKGVVAGIAVEAARTGGGPAVASALILPGIQDQLKVIEAQNAASIADREQIHQTLVQQAVNVAPCEPQIEPRSNPS